LIVGNLAEIPFINSKLKNLVVGNEFISGVILSQCLSNVPTAIMLSKFTSDGTELMLGVDIGGLGTLIASMASMISYDFYVKVEGADKKKYILSFTWYNIAFLIGMLLLKLIL
jgi:Na+/H+ antiporter NhaD/arsenite permease-like protein